MFQYILFDLDGTLTDPGEGITKSIAYAFDHYGVAYTSLDELKKYIGPPLIREFSQCLHVDMDTAFAYVTKFRERYNTIGWKENHPIPGMAEALVTLKEAGCKLAVATSKPLPTAIMVLEHFDMARHFEVICGADADGGHADKAYIVSQALERLGVTEDKKVQAVMVGDRMHDVVGGQKNGLTTVGLTMGYGSREEFAGAGVSYVADSAEEMVAYLLK